MPQCTSRDGLAVLPFFAFCLNSAELIEDYWPCGMGLERLSTESCLLRLLPGEVVLMK